jgi:hypothetical protein
VLRNVFAKTLRDQRRSLGWWSLGLVAVVAVYVLPYRQFLDSGMLDNNTTRPSTRPWVMTTRPPATCGAPCSRCWGRCWW